ncbi:DUF262 domain-containing protein [Stenotrophomonas maltophilia]|uniref:HNH endonuclease family protein n=1 Tax=Stenotrophomonas TaxID=40323 RepID=UPI0007F8DCA7|nr:MULTISPECIES: DUF262 domain-containing protein [Stenotrophomonas]MBH1523897.1 DUF262 domain-containing protein [Stenotrophomonas maltophilia]MBH1671991.1 DUF262 domain-containing protein [Stenotrophomonas maltophilia]MBN5154825.1 DUF262 domain-containing protein [Stenotrophomonas maltophilia]MDG9975734.1 DUF262 domain-containing protein [Stenotrophomonas sp. GD04032]MDT3491025.1 DUF262 domain-containing protein [Stenotrophomonas maltophilia group sp. msm4]
MKIKLTNIPVSELTKGYKDNAELGVRGYDGKLNIRPAYQREFIYKEKQRNEVIKTVMRGFPLNTMYWAVSDDGYELMDGQQRTISICQYVHGDFSVVVDGNPMSFGNLTSDKKKNILDYDLSIYICEGSDSDKLDWFKTINIAGEKLTQQELRNAIYSGPWLTDAKRWFSKSGAPAVQEGREKLVNGSPIRQEILETALDWRSQGDIETYMSTYQHSKDAQDLWQYWQSVFAWVKRIFPNQESARARLMKGLPWGYFYNAHKDETFNAQDLEERISALIEDDEVDNKKGIYEYLLTGQERTLSLRSFDEKTRQKKYAEQQGKCPICKKQFSIEEMEADHILPWHSGGKTNIDNCQLLCKKDNRTKSGK